MNDTSGFHEVRFPPSNHQCIGSLQEQRLQFPTALRHLLRTSLAVTGMLLSLSACSADLVVHGVKDPTVFNGIRVYTPANYIVTTEILTKDCPSKSTHSIVQLPEPYDVTVKSAWFAKSEFRLMLTDTGLLKEVTLNSTPQLAENLTAMAALAKAIGETIKPTPSLRQVDCGAVLSEKIVKVEKLTLLP